MVLVGDVMVIWVVFLEAIFVTGLVAWRDEISILVSVFRM